MAKAILIVLDGLGVGHAPDAEAFGDAGSNTLANMAANVGGVNIPNLRRLGLGNIQPLEGAGPVEAPAAGYGRLQEVSAGKDSTTGHWEMMGLVTEQPFPTYPDGFPHDVIAEFTRRTGYGVLGNKAASGTAIIEELGDEHIATGKLIVYTSADSVFQIAAHDKVCPLEELYRVCEIAREMLDGRHRVSRVIARPFTGPSGAYQRTEYRHDYSVEPPQGSLVLTGLQQHGVKVLSIGKIYDLFAGTGIDETFPSRNNGEGMAMLEQHYGAAGDNTLILLNLVDFDMLWGHRNDPRGMKQGLEIFDAWLGDFLPRMARGDLLIMTADHGNDPTTPSTDHSREHVATFCDFFGAPAPRKGSSFLPLLRN
ncbi:phosphopentomutase [bacterium DOLJORAL78_65_58]|nr:MAG: phosphopentomutase [bacterium DOLJORAL78_65_58]